MKSSWSIPQPLQKVYSILNLSDAAPFVRLTELLVFFASQYYCAVLSFAFSLSYIATITPHLSKY